jgi:hypothetical protein
MVFGHIGRLAAGSLLAREDKSIQTMSQTHRVKGMVSFGGNTYRIERIDIGHYAAVRLTDDKRIGTFWTGNPLRVEAERADEDLVYAIARTAVMNAKTSWAYHRSPTPPPVSEPAKVVEEPDGPLTPRRLISA